MYLGRGERRVVPMTKRIEALVAGGYVRVLDTETVLLGRRGPDD